MSSAVLSLTNPMAGRTQMQYNQLRKMNTICKLDQLGFDRNIVLQRHSRYEERDY